MIAEVRGCAERARKHGRRQILVAHRALAGPVDPLRAFEVLQAGAGRAREARAEGASRPRDARERGASPLQYWERREAGLGWTAIGSVVELRATGANRFREIAERMRAERRHITLVGAGPSCELPLWVGGFAFDDAPSRDARWQAHPPAAWLLPAGMLVRHPAGGTAIAIAAIGSEARADEVARELAERLDSLERAASAPRVERTAQRDGEEARAAAPECRTRPDRPHPAFRGLVRAAVEAISRGELEKVVVARALDLERSDPVRVGRLLAELRRTHPSSACFAVQRGSSLFLGATPELLVDLAGAARRVSTRAVAGSAPRGRHPDEDRALARALRESKKEQEEHASVVRMLRASLQPRCGELDGPESPRILALPGIQHLETPLCGVLAPGDPANVVDLAGDLHPTPAVCGAPRAGAQRWLAAHEALDRGWYAGCLGWVDAAGGGQLWVALRSALVSGRSLRLYAGAGVVAGSDPECELRETRLKLQTLLAPVLEV